jgi:hypothetical protein
LSLKEDNQNLLLRIESLRAELNELSWRKTPSDPEMIILSEQLDTLLNEYYRAMKYDNNKPFHNLGRLLL